MNVGEAAFYVGIGVGNFLIATEWAKYGILEIGIQRPINSRAMAGVFVGVITIFISGLAHRFIGFEISQNIAIMITGAALLWIPFYRYLILPAGLNAFNKARTRTFFWSITGNFIPGEKLTEKAESLRGFGMAITAEKLFKHSIELQLKGQRVQSLSNVVEISDDIIAGWGDTYRIRCPGCPFEVRIPMVHGRNMSGVWNMCGAMITVRIQENKIYVNAILRKPIHIVSDQNRYNAAVAYEELALLYRMMHRFDEAKEALGESREIVGQILDESPLNSGYLKLKSLVIFRLAEINHVQGNLKEARVGYEESLAIDKKHGDAEGIKMNGMLLEKLGA